MASRSLFDHASLPCAMLSHLVSERTSRLSGTTPARRLTAFPSQREEVSSHLPLPREPRSYLVRSPGGDCNGCRMTWSRCLSRRNRTPRNRHRTLVFSRIWAHRLPYHRPCPCGPCGAAPAAAGQRSLAPLHRPRLRLRLRHRGRCPPRHSHHPRRYIRQTPEAISPTLQHLSRPRLRRRPRHPPQLRRVRQSSVAVPHRRARPPLQRGAAPVHEP